MAKRKRRSKQQKGVPLAWMGWSARIPPEWRPLRITGEWRKGTMVLGDADAALVQIRWWRPGRKRFDAARWIAKRLRRVAGARGGPPESETDGPPQPAGFEHVAWVPRGLWYGYAPHADLVIEVVVNSAVRERDRKDITRRVLPSLRASRPDGETPLSLFGASFTAGAGFRPTDWHLHLGDIALRLRSPSGPERGALLLRQVYPAELALSRRTLERWLEASPFAGRRVLRPRVEPEPCSVTIHGRELSGVSRRGVKRLPRPLGWLRPVNSMAVAVRDTELGRLLLAEYDTSLRAARSVGWEAPRRAPVLPARGGRPDDQERPGPTGAASEHAEETVTSAIAGMNWAMRDAAVGTTTALNKDGQDRQDVCRSQS